MSPEWSAAPPSLRSRTYGARTSSPLDERPLRTPGAAARAQRRPTRTLCSRGWRVPWERRLLDRGSRRHARRLTVPPAAPGKGRSVSHTRCRSSAMVLRVPRDEPTSGLLHLPVRRSVRCGQEEVGVQDRLDLVATRHRPPFLEFVPRPHGARGARLSPSPARERVVAESREASASDMPSRR